MITWLIFFFGTGLAFFVGVALQYLGLLLSIRWHGRRAGMIVTLTCIIGLILVAVSAVPLPYWLYAIVGLISLFWLVTERWERLTTARKPTRWLVTAAWLAALAWELPYQVSPNVPHLGRTRLVLIGDSISAGAGESGVIYWPALLKHPSMSILNLSFPGAKVRTAAKRIRENQLNEDDLVLLEIGGNDVLGRTPVDEYERDLEELLRLVCDQKRYVIMFELPAPPLGNDYGLAQRRLAARYKVTLIPKRVFVAVIASGDATIDSLHLTPSGHAHMADTVWRIIGPAFEATP